MDNHYHLLVRTPEANLQRIMRHINGQYTQSFNRTGHREGPLFRGRYKSVLVEAETYWLGLTRYIHRNPLEAGLVRNLSDYPWSSYPAYMGAAETPEWLNTEYTLRSIGQRNVKARYAAYVAEDGEDAVSVFYANRQAGSILAEEPFRSRVLAGKPTSVDVPELRRARRAPSVDEIVAAVTRKFGVDEQSVWRKTRGRGSAGPARSTAMFLCHQVTDMRLTEIAELFGLASYASAGSTIRALRLKMEEDADLKNAIDYILLELTP